VAAVAVYDEAFANWQQVYRRMLDLCDDGLLSPLWRAAGAEAQPAPANLAQLGRH
jgi:hypothetical protein